MPSLNTLSIESCRALFRVGFVVTVMTLCTVFVAGCPEREPPDLLPLSVEAICTLRGADAAGGPVGSVQVALTHSPGGPFSPHPRVVDMIANVQGSPAFSIVDLRRVDLTARRTSPSASIVPFQESYYIQSISRATAIGSTFPGTSWVAAHIGDLAMLRVTPESLSAPVLVSFDEFPPAQLRSPGFTSVSRVETDDVIIPFNAPDLPTDMRRFADAFLTALSSRIRPELAASRDLINTISMAGPNNDGDFRLFFIPHVRHSSSSRNFKGFGLIARITITVKTPTFGVPINTATVFIPISFLFEPVDVSPLAGGGQVFTAVMDPFDFISSSTPSDNLDRIIVVPDGILDSVVEEKIRTGITDVLTGLSTEQLEEISLPIRAFAIAISESRPSNANIPADFDIMLLPETNPSTISGSTVRNQIMPIDGGVPVKIVIME